MFKSGFVTIIGKPNSGKSTLINQLLGQKISIATYRTNTTRNQIKGIYNDEESQIIFIDTPGFIKEKSVLEKQMKQRIHDSLQGVDIILFLLPFWKEFDDDYINKVNLLKNKDSKKYLLLNKIDKLEKNSNEVFEKAKDLNKLDIFDKIIPISGLKDSNLDILLKEIKSDLNPGIPFYEKDQSTEMTEEFYFSEIIREKILFNLKNEIPHDTLVKVEEIKKNKTTYIFANIYISRESLKKIIIGKDGSMLKTIGIAARKEIEKTTNTKVNLELFIKVKKNWKDKESIVKFI